MNDVHSGIPPLQPGEFRANSGIPILPEASTSDLNGHTIALNVKQDSTLKKCAATVLNFFINPPFALKLAVGLTLVGISIVTFVALSPKLLILATAVGAIGLIVLMSATISKIMKPSKDEIAYNAQIKTLVKNQLINPLENLSEKLQNHAYYDQKKKIEPFLDHIKTSETRLFSADPDVVEVRINELKKMAVNKLLDDFKDLDGLGLFRKLVPETETNRELHEVAVWLFLNSNNIDNPKYVESVDKRIIMLYDALTKAPEVQQ
jgi:hypothetical protein